jgi:hypothetical protein
MNDEQDELERIWADQADFNRLFRDVESMTFARRTAETKELTLHLISECDELLRASGAWKFHRRVDVMENPRAIGLELADIFKYLISIAQVHGFSAQDLVRLYWEKSMVVRQRYSQEYVNRDLDIPAVIVDIDNVLADYITGFVAWLVRHADVSGEVAQSILDRPRYIKAETLAMTEEAYRIALHQFRVSGQHARLPIMPGAKEFLDRIQSRRWATILLTARPIDRYPNLFSETLTWLRHHGLPFQWIWWARDKGEAIRSVQPTPYIEWAVDDEFRYVEQMAAVGARVFWLNTHGTTTPNQQWVLAEQPRITMIRSLQELHDHLTPTHRSAV